MIANQIMTLLNRRIEKDTRREVYIPTIINGVSIVSSMAFGGTSDRSDNDSYTIRIPIAAEFQYGREYIDVDDYHQLSDKECMKYWTLQKGAYIIPGALELDTPVDGEAISKLKRSGKTITITSFRDNTFRGSYYLKHWRVGGA